MVQQNLPGVWSKYYAIQPGGKHWAKLHGKECCRTTTLRPWNVPSRAHFKPAAINQYGSRQNATGSGGLRRIRLLLYFLVIMSMPFLRHQFWDAEFGPGLTVTKLLGAICLLYALSYLAPPPRDSPLFRDAASQGDDHVFRDGRLLPPQQGMAGYDTSISSTRFTCTARPLCSSLSP